VEKKKEEVWRLEYERPGREKGETGGFLDVGGGGGRDGKNGQPRVLFKEKKEE